MQIVLKHPNDDEVKIINLFSRGRGSLFYQNRDQFFLHIHNTLCIIWYLFSAQKYQSQRLSNVKKITFMFYTGKVFNFIHNISEKCKSPWRTQTDQGRWAKKKN